MNQLPRSERFWFYAIITFALFLVISASIASCRAWQGKTPPPPAYENAPPRAVAGPDEDGIVNVANAQRPPISDDDFLTLHRTTRLLVTRLLKGDWHAELTRWGINRGVVAEAAGELEEIRSLLAGAQMSGSKGVYVTRPINSKSETGGYVLTVDIGDDGQLSSESTISFTFFWTKKGGAWRIFGVSTELSADRSGAGATRGGDGVPEPPDNRDGAAPAPAAADDQASPDDQNTPTG